MTERRKMDLKNSIENSANFVSANMGAETVVGRYLQLRGALKVPVLLFELDQTDASLRPSGITSLRR